MDDALKLIIARSPAATAEAVSTLRAIGAKSPTVQQRYQHTVELALNDPDADFTADERSLIASYLEVVNDTARRDKLVQVRVTAEERETLDRLAHMAGYNGNVSEWTRSLWGV